MSAVKSFNLLYHIYTAYPRSQQSSDANTGIKHHLFYEAFEQLTRRDGCVAFSRSANGFHSIRATSPLFCWRITTLFFLLIICMDLHLCDRRPWTSGEEWLHNGVRGLSEPLSALSCGRCLTDQQSMLAGFHANASLVTMEPSSFKKNFFFVKIKERKSSIWCIQRQLFGSTF